MISIGAGEYEYLQKEHFFVNNVTSRILFFETEIDICCDNVNLKIHTTGVPTNILCAYIEDMQLQG